MPPSCYLQPHIYLATTHSAASTPIATATSPPSALTLAAPAVDVANGAVTLPPVEVTNGVVTLPPVVTAPGGVNLASFTFVKLLWCSTALPVILPATGAVGPVQ